MKKQIFDINKEYKIVEENVYHVGDWCYGLGVKGTLDENFLSGIDEWVQVSESMYYDQLNCVPPRYQTGKCFMVGEPYSNEFSATFIQVNGYYFGKMCRHSTFNPSTYLTEVYQQFEF